MVDLDIRIEKRQEQDFKREHSQLDSLITAGIKVSRLRTREGRIFNICILNKQFLSEVIYISLQTMPIIQLSSLLLMSTSSLYFVLYCGFYKKIFDGRTTLLSILATESSVFFLIVLGLYKQVTDNSYSNSPSEYIQFSMIIMLFLSTVIGLLEFVIDIFVLVYKALRRMVIARRLSFARKARESLAKKLANHIDFQKPGSSKNEVQITQLMKPSKPRISRVKISEEPKYRIINFKSPQARAESGSINVRTAILRSNQFRRPA